MYMRGQKSGLVYSGWWEGFAQVPEGESRLRVLGSMELLSPKKPQSPECAKGASKASCGEMVVQKGDFGESVSSLPLKVCS